MTAWAAITPLVKLINQIPTAARALISYRSYCPASSIADHVGYMRRNHAIAPAVSHRLPTAAARVRAQVGSCGICGGNSGTGPRFLPLLRFPLPIFIAPNVPHPSTIQANKICPVVASLPHEIKKSGGNLTTLFQQIKKV
jgi:hypothetical protein